MNLSNGQYPNPEDRALWVEFFWHAEYLETRSLKEGRPIYEQVEYVRIIVPGGKTVIERPAKDADKTRFPYQYGDFKKGSERPTSGWMIEEWPAINKAQAAMLKHQNIHTVEQLSAYPDGALAQLGPGGLDLRNKAKEALNLYEDAKKLKEVKEECLSLKKEVETLRELLKANKGVKHEPNK